MSDKVQIPHDGGELLAAVTDDIIHFTNDVNTSALRGNSLDPATARAGGEINADKSVTGDTMGEALGISFSPVVVRFEPKLRP